MSDVDLLVTNAGHLLTMVGPDGETRGPRRGDALGHLGDIENGAVAIRDDTIVAVGAARDVAASVDAAHVVDARGGVVMPGLIDTHTHLVWAGSRSWELDQKLQGRTYREITEAGGGIPYTVGATRAASLAELRDAGISRARCALMQGTTRLEAKSGYGLDADSETAQLQAIRAVADVVPQDVTATFLGLHERPPEHREDVGPYVEEMRRETLPALIEAGLVDFVDAFIETGVYTPDEVRPVLEEARKRGIPLRLHVDEFSDLDGAAFAVELGARSADHLLSVSEGGIDALAGSDTVATLLPMVPFTIRDPTYAPFRRLHEAGAIVALASDFNPNVPCLDMMTVIRHAVYGMGMRPREALVAATVNAGYSLDPDAGFGVLAPGHPADLVVTDAQDPLELAYGLARDVVRKVIVGGVPVTPEAIRPAL